MESNHFRPWPDLRNFSRSLAALCSGCDFLVGIVLATSFLLRLVIRAKASFNMKIEAKMEANMKTAIKRICVVAGTALLGWSGDMFLNYRGKALIDLELNV